MSQYYKLHYKGHIFYAKVDDTESDGTVTIRVGGPRVKCVTLHMYADENYIYLQDLFYDHLCSLEGSLEKSVGTTYLVQAALLLCHKLNPSIARVELTDQSVVRCDNRGKVLPLPEVYMLLYGNTWYASKFQVHIHNWSVQAKKKYTQLALLLKEKPKMNFEDLWVSYLSMNFAENRKSYVQYKYNVATSWYEFFQSIRENNCVYWFDWVRNLFLKLSKGLALSGSSWCFKIQYSEAIVIEQTEEIVILIVQTRSVRLFGGYSAKSRRKT